VEDKMIKLPQESIILLKKCVEAHNPELIKVIESDLNNVLTKDIYNKLREAVCDELVMNGFEGDEPTMYGMELENLIDEIGRLFM
jgi:hypothetical protein